jgi:hypothetical protein
MAGDEREGQDKDKRFSLQDLGIRIERARIKLGPLLINIEDTEAAPEPSKKENLEAERDKLLERLREIDRKLHGEKPEP